MQAPQGQERETQSKPFVTDTAVVRVEADRWHADLAEGWSSLVGIHGGYVTAIAARAIGEAVDDPDKPLRTLSAQFLRSPRPGQVEIEVDVERRGRSLVFVSARVRQRDRTVVLVRSTSAGASAGLTYDHHRPPLRLPAPPEGSERFDTVGITRHMEQVEVVMDPAVVPFSGTGDAWLGAWLRPLDHEPVDNLWLVMACDALPPAVFSRTTGPTRAATIDYTVHLPLADPAVHVPPGAHVYMDCRSAIAADGMAFEDGALWGPDGRVLAVSRQTRLADARGPR